jgi:hypothetical protein
MSQRRLLPPSSLIVLVMEAINMSETSDNFCPNTRRNNPENSHLLLKMSLGTVEDHGKHVQIAGIETEMG